jgi:putative DNA methylase
MYPRAILEDGSTAKVIAWLWARTIPCPNPACGINMPLLRSWWIGKKKGRETFVRAEIDGRDVRFTVSRDPKLAPVNDTGTVGRNGATCIRCGSAVDLKYIRSAAKAGRMSSRLLAIVAEGTRERIYLSPDAAHEAAALVERPLDVPKGLLGDDPRAITAPNYGLTSFADLFTARQLVTLTELTLLVKDARSKVLEDARRIGSERGSDSARPPDAYADAVATMLGLAVSRTADLNNSLVTWSSSRDQPRNLFSRQAIPMTWDFVEVSPFGGAAGDVSISVRTAGEAIEQLGHGVPGEVVQADASTRSFPTAAIATDPPYYDNIGYADLSDFFYVWLRRSLREVHPDLLSTMLTPKVEELVANPYRHGGKMGARKFFEDGFQHVFARARVDASTEWPATMFYAFKQSEEDDEGHASTGWETLLEGMVGSGWCITSTWPMRSERAGRMRDVGSNALASSVVLSLRPRPGAAPVADRRGFTAELRQELPERLRELQQGSIAPVDLAQAAIGPGMAIFSKHSRVVEANGDSMSVRSALQVINQVLGEVLTAQEGDFDAGTRWCVKWFESYGFDPGPYGEAETLASAFNTSVARLDRSGSLTARGGKVQLFAPASLHQAYDPRADNDITLWEIVVHLAKALDAEGLNSAGSLMARAAARIDLDAAKELAYLLFSIAEKKRWSGVAQLFNMLAASWADVLDAARRTPDGAGEQLALDAAY